MKTVHTLARNNVRSSLVAILLATFFIAVLPADVQAATCGGVETTLLNCSSSGGKEVNGAWSILLAVINILTAGIVIVAIGAIVYAAILYTTASDNESQLTKSKDMIRNTIIGLGTFAVMFSFIQFIIPGGAFGSGGPLLVTERGNSSSTWSSKGGGSGNSNSSYTGGSESSEGSPIPVDLGSGTCYTVTSQSGSQTAGRMFHQSGNQTYAFENSPEGIRYAANHNYDSIDLDIRVTKDGVPVATHWEKPMVRDGFSDPSGRLSRNTSVSKMTFDEISRLRNRDGQSRIYSLQELIGVLATQNVNLSLEMKTPQTLRNKLPQIASMLNEKNVKAYVKGFMFENGMAESLKTATRLGFWAKGIDRPWQRPEPGANCR